ncbi:fused MFS/spermidine synthase [candidate division KSB1 bacterium]|nr:fused MFS/spermidine synthase [candidate division KSB1 bacterium]
MNFLNRFIVILSVFLSAFLLFVIEPMVGRMITPVFGGSAYVWAVCLMMYQGFVFIGYLYAHTVAPRIGKWHLLIVLIPIIQLPIHVAGNVAPDFPIIVLITRLLKHASFPFVILATNAVVVQWRFAMANNNDTREPYDLYVASNAGSLVALLAYPFLIEPFIGLKMQQLFWNVGYGIFVLTSVATWWVLRPNIVTSGRVRHEADLTGDKLNLRIYLKWFALSVVPSVMLIALTNKVTMEVGSFPLMWVIPLALYLASFILAFSNRSLLRRYWVELSWLFIFACTLLLHWWLILALFGLFFLMCWLTHYELYHLRPDKQKLTVYYLVIALGGWCGGLFSVLLAPKLFTGFYEIYFLIAVNGLIFVGIGKRLDIGWWKDASLLKAVVRLSVFITSIVLITYQWHYNFIDAAHVLERHRNFFGVYQIRARQTNDGQDYIELRHGNTIHGRQYIDKNKRRLPLAYYYNGGAFHRVKHLYGNPVKMAVIGLGCGSMAAWLHTGDELAFYEIDADLDAFVRRKFTFLNSSAGKIEVRTGDARLQLAEESDATLYDILIVDAFTGDGIPVHLLTKEAVQTYFDRIEPDGVIVFHISNRYYDLRGVLKSLAIHFDVNAAWTEGRDGDVPPELCVKPMLFCMTKNNWIIKQLQDFGWQPLDDMSTIYNTLAWSDDYYNILRPIYESYVRHLR